MLLDELHDLLFINYLQIPVFIEKGTGRKPCAFDYFPIRLPFCLLTSLIFLWRDELIALAVNIDDFNLVIILQVLAQLGDVNVHRTSVEIVVVYPDGLQSKVALQYFVRM